MKILYVGSERAAAAQAARGLPGIAANVTVAFADTFGMALRWFAANRDAGAIVVEAEVQGHACAPFVERIRSLDPTVPAVIVITRPEHSLAALNAGADGWVLGNRAEADLPRVVAGAVRRERARREAVSRQLIEVEAARRDAEQRLAEDQARHAAALARETRIGTALQQRLLELETRLRQADERGASDAAASADLLAKRHAEFTARLTEASQWRDTLTANLAAATAALDDAQQQRAAEAAAAAERLARREAELGAALAQAVAARTALERALADAEAAHRESRQRAAADLAAASERHAALEDLLAQETEARRLLDRKLAAADAARQEADRRHAEDMTTAAMRLAEVQARHDAALEESTGARADAERQLRAKDEDLRRAHGERDTLRQTLHAAEEQLTQLRAATEEERQAHERDRASSDAELQRVTADYDHLRQSLDRLQSAFQALEHVAGEHAAERARLESVLAERDSELSAQAARHRAAEQEAQGALAQVQEQLRRAVEASGSEIAALQRQNDALRRELDTARVDGAALQRTAERVPVLQKELDASRNEWRRQFERAPYGLCRCGQDGRITDINHALVKLLGRQHADDLRNADFAAAVSDSAGDVRWLIERARRTRKTESVETSWKTGDGRSLIVRLRALSTLDGAIDIIVEDLTRRRALEERLRRAQGMEAVGRLASEAAVNCEAVLRDATHHAHEWVGALGAASPLRAHGERLLEELGRAASLLRQVGTHASEQMAANEPVSVPRVLHDLAPVLQRVAGDGIELALPKTSGAFDVAVDARRIERMLVNLAGYARGRMPDGGGLRIDLASIDLGRRFAERYPAVRPGAYVLMTVTEVRHAVPQGSIPHAARSASAPSDLPGLELHALADLVAQSHGHLWIDAPPAGNMVVKIHLPKHAADTGAASGPERRSGRGTGLTRWFRRASTPADS